MRDDAVTLDHGSGGRATHDLVREVFAGALGNEYLRQMNDAALLPPPAGALAVTTDCFVVTPLFFPGGDIGSLAVHGTVNDLAMRGARPLSLTAGFILEEGLPLENLRRIAASMGEAARRAAVPVVAGDTKVVPRGKADGCFICTTGVGVVPEGLLIGGERARPGDVLLVSGTVADHGTAVLSAREGLSFGGGIESDSAALNGLVAGMLAAGTVHVLRDPTRGGVATTLNEIASQSGVGIEVEEGAVPVRDDVRGACEMLGLDPLYVANEGKLLALAPPGAAGAVLSAMRAHPLGRGAAVIGRASAENPGRVILRTAIGGRRLLEMLHGEPLPRIC